MAEAGDASSQPIPVPLARWRSQAIGTTAISGRPSDRADDLLIGLGNTLRGDDGVGPHLAQWVQRRWPALNVRCVQQLTPELSIPLAEARRVLFIDAWQGPEPDGQAPIPGGPAACNQTPLAPAEEQVASASKAMDDEAEWLSPRGLRAGGKERGRAGVSAAVADAGDPCPCGPVLTPLAPLPPGAGDPGEVGAFSHRLDPQQLLAITALLHDRVPEAWMLLVPAFCCAHGEGLSVELQALLPQARTLLQQWIRLAAEESEGWLGSHQGSAVATGSASPGAGVPLPERLSAPQASRHA